MYYLRVKLEHLSTNEENTCIKEKVRKEKCYFKYAYVSKQGDRDCAERFLYDHYTPQCNKVKPSAEPCEIVTV